MAHLCAKISRLMAVLLLGLGLSNPVHGAERFRVIILDDDNGTAYLRIDTQTGSLSRCQQVDAVWTCEPMQEETRNQTQSTFDDLHQRVTELENRVAQLEAERNIPLNRAEVEDALLLSETIMRRFFGMVQDIKRDMAE